MNKTKVNYWIDMVIAVAFIMSAISGLVFLLPISNSTAFGIAYSIWDQVHTWSSLLMIAGVLAHFILHWKWLVAMTKKIFLPPAKPVHSAVGANATLMSRRQFLRTAGLGAAGLGAAALGMGMVAVSFKSILGSSSAEESQPVTGGAVIQPEATSTASGNEPVVENQVVTDEVVAQPEAVSPTSTATPTQSPAASEPVEENQMVTDEVVITDEVVATDEVVVQPEATSIPPTVVPTQSITVAPSSQTTSVACRKGIAYNPYPGKCRHYVDNDGDGYCDLSIPT